MSTTATATAATSFTAYEDAVEAFQAANHSVTLAQAAYDAVRDSTDQGAGVAARRDRYRATVRMQELCDAADDAREALYGRGQERTA